MAKMTIFSICAVLATAALVAAVIYLISTLRQVERTARALEQFLLHADETAQLTKNAAQKISALANEMENGWGRTLSFAGGLLWAVKDKFFKNSAHSEKKEEEVQKTHG